MSILYEYTKKTFNFRKYLIVCIAQLIFAYLSHILDIPDGQPHHEVHQDDGHEEKEGAEDNSGHPT